MTLVCSAWDSRLWLLLWQQPLLLFPSWEKWCDIYSYSHCGRRRCWMTYRYTLSPGHAADSPAVEPPWIVPSPPPDSSTAACPRSFPRWQLEHYHGNMYSIHTQSLPASITMETCTALPYRAYQLLSPWKHVQRYHTELNSFYCHRLYLPLDNLQILNNEISLLLGLNASATASHTETVIMTMMKCTE